MLARRRLVDARHGRACVDREGHELVRPEDGRARERLELGGRLEQQASAKRVPRSRASALWTTAASASDTHGAVSRSAGTPLLVSAIARAGRLTFRGKAGAPFSA